MAKKPHPAVAKAQAAHKQLGEALAQIAQAMPQQQEQPAGPEGLPGPMPGGMSPLGGQAK